MQIKPSHIKCEMFYELIATKCKIEFKMQIDLTYHCKFHENTSKNERGLTRIWKIVDKKA